MSGRGDTAHPHIHPDVTRAFGAEELLAEGLTGVLVTARPPPDLVLPITDAIGVIARSHMSVIGGFQTPIERWALDLFLRSGTPVVVCLSRWFEPEALPSSWLAAAAKGYLLVLATSQLSRVTGRSGLDRNRVVVELAMEVFIPAATATSRTFRAATDAIARSRPLYCLDHPRNADLMMIGAEPIECRTTAWSSASVPISWRGTER